MAENTEVPPTEGNEPPEGEAAPEAKGAAEQPAALGAEELAQLRRDAAQAKASQRRASELERELSGYRDKARQAELDAAGEDGKLQVELKQARERAEAAERKALLAERKAAYPLAAKELEDDLAALSEERVAALNAALTREAAEAAEPPTPRGQNASRQDGSAAGSGQPQEESSADILARLRATPIPPEWGGTAG